MRSLVKHYKFVSSFNTFRYSTYSTKQHELPTQAEIVIIGGGCVGLGVGYSLAKAGKKDVLLLEKESSLCAVTSAQAAGLVGQVRNSVHRVKLAKWSVETFAKLQRYGEENDVITPSWRQVGSLRVAQTDERVEEFKQLIQVCKQAGLEVRLVDTKEAERLWPGMKFSKNAKAVLWCPTDGYLQPHDLAMTFHYHARRMGVKFATNVLVEGIEVKNGRVNSVKTNRGTVKCEYVINAAGAHAFHIAQFVGLKLPIFPVRHEYMITQPIEPSGNIKPSYPCFRIMDATLYGRPDVNSVLLGGWEPNAKSLDPISYSYSEELPGIQEDWPVLENFAVQFSPFFPKIETTGIRKVFSGWPTFTPDGKFIIGESNKVKGFVMAGGCNAHGVSGSAGIGQHVVESMFEKNVSEYVKGLNPNRFEEGSDWESWRTQAQRVYETYYNLQVSK